MSSSTVPISEVSENHDAHLNPSTPSQKPPLRRRNADAEQIPVDRDPDKAPATDHPDNGGLNQESADTHWEVTNPFISESFNTSAISSSTKSDVKKKKEYSLNHLPNDTGPLTYARSTTRSGKGYGQMPQGTGSKSIVKDVVTPSNPFNMKEDGLEYLGPPSSGAESSPDSVKSSPPSPIFSDGGTETPSSIISTDDSGDADFEPQSPATNQLTRKCLGKDQQQSKQEPLMSGEIDTNSKPPARKGRGQGGRKKSPDAAVESPVSGNSQVHIKMQSPRTVHDNKPIDKPVKKILNLMEKTAGVRELPRGYVYAFYDASAPKLLKIGTCHEKKDYEYYPIILPIDTNSKTQSKGYYVWTRIRAQERRCMRNMRFAFAVYMPCAAGRMETLIHKALHEYNHKISCDGFGGCPNHNHDEWFMVSADMALHTILAWKKFSDLMPYDMDSGELNVFWKDYVSTIMPAHETSTVEEWVSASWRKFLNHQCALRDIPRIEIPEIRISPPSEGEPEASSNHDQESDSHLRYVEIPKTSRRVPSEREPKVSPRQGQASEAGTNRGKEPERLHEKEEDCEAVPNSDLHQATTGQDEGPKRRRRRGRRGKKRNETKDVQEMGKGIVLDTAAGKVEIHIHIHVESPSGDRNRQRGTRGKGLK